VGTWKHGYENYVAMRADPTLCFLSRCGPPSDRELQMATSNTQPNTPALNDDDLDDEDTNEESSLKSKNRDASEANSEVAEPSPGPSASSETQPPDGDDREEGLDDKPSWPTITDLNTRLRRVITSYQRNYRKEEQKLAAAKAKPSIEPALSSPLAALAQVSQQFDVREAAALGLQGWDLQQLALYLLMERQGKQAMEHALRERDRERERATIAKRWTKREEADFFRVASSYGIIYYRKKKSYDWTKFKQLAKLEKKSDDDLTEYYKHFVMMCKKQTGVHSDDGSYDTTIEHISEEKARRTLERLELLSRIREEIITHSKLDERLKVCVTSADMPDWWIAGKHDKDLLLGVAKHGLGRTDYYLLNDPDLSFQEVLRKKVNSEALAAENKDAIKLESHEDILKFDKDEILVKLEKGEGTLKIEKVAVKKENTEDKEKKIEESSKVELTIVKSEKSECEEKPKSEENEKTEVEDEVKEEKESSPGVTEESVETSDDKNKEEIENKEDQAESNDDKEVSKPEAEDNQEKEPAATDKTVEENKSSSENQKVEEVTNEVKEKVEVKPAKTKFDEESDLCSKQAAELKAMFPDLEVIQPLSRLSQVDTFVLRDKQGTGALDFSETTVAQLFNNAVKWPKEYAIQVRLQHIIYAIETKEWPATKSFSAYATGIGNEFDIPVHELPNDPPKRDSSTPMSLGDPDVISINTERSNLNKKRKRHIAIDVETERAKLHALLNSSHMTNPKHGLSSWDEDSEDSRRSTPVQGNLQPPPAHQQTTRLLSMPYDKYHSPKTIGQTTVIPGTSSTLTPIDLSSSLPKSSDKNLDMQNEVQDFSMPSKKQAALSGSKSGNKLDDTLSKLMKRKNCPVEEPVVGKEKKRRKLDEIVLGLSAAKEQSLFPESSKKPTVTPSVTVTPTSAPVSSSHNISQKPFTITVTSVPSTAPSTRNNSIPNLLPSSLSSSSTSKDSFSTFLAQAEQQNLLLKKQQQQRKSYEAMIADIGSSKVNSYSHEAKVNKWLAEQNAALAEQPLGADYLSPRRRRPRIDPTLLDWKKLTGDENVSVIHRVSGKKLTGPKAPTLKRLGQWLVENPMYDIDPKWAELVKERGNLSHDLQKRVPGSGGKKSAPGRPPLLSSPTGSTSSVSSANINTSIPSSLSFPTLSASGLSGINSNLLSGLSGLGQFDPKNNPLLMPFAGLPNMNALSSMGGLGNLTNMNLFANLAGLGLPGLGAMDAASLTGETKSSSSKNSSSKPQKPQEAHSSSKSQSSSNSSIPTTNPFPFFFPNPSLLYTPLGLGGLNPFTLQPGMSAAYDTLAQQCGLLNGNLNPAASPNSGMKTSKSSSSSRPSSSSTVTTATSSSGVKPLRSSREAQLQQLLLPPDTQILESISKAASSLDANLKQSKSDKKEDKRKALESLRGMLPTDFTTSSDKYKEKKGMSGLADFTKLLEAQTGSTKKAQDLQMKDAIEQLRENNAELMAKPIGDDSISTKRPRDSSDSAETSLCEENPQKKFKEDQSPQPEKNVGNQSIDQEGVDIETLLPPSTVVKTLCVNVEKLQEKPKEKCEIEDKKEHSPPSPPKESEFKEIEEKKEESAPPPAEAPPESPPKKSTKRTRGKRKSGELPPIDPEAIIEKKNLRSSASRSAAAAAARAAAEQAAAKQAEAENAQKLQDSSESAS
jgi:chromodomain-helicase-DNA-binding protein 7